MNYTKPTPIGVDYPIQQLQIAMYGDLISNFGLTSDQYDSYGRVYKNINNRNGGYIPQPFTGDSAIDYVQDSFLNDRKVITSFFDISENISVNQNLLCSTKIYLYFFLKLDGLYPNATTRNDEEFINTVVNFINTKYRHIVTSRAIGMNTILKDYTGYKGGTMDVQNYQPSLCFKLEIAMDNYLIRQYRNYREGTVYSPVWVKAVPTGIDYWIQLLQVHMFTYLLSIWNIEAEQYNCYGRIYRNKDSDKTYIPQFFTGVQEYTSDTFLDDTKAVTSYFDAGEIVKVNKGNGLDTATIFLYFFVDLSKIYADNTYRNDEECRMDVVGWINTKYKFLVKGVMVGIKKVMSDYTGNIKRMMLNKDMQPIHIFRIELLLPLYNTAQNACGSFTARQYEFAPTEFANTEFA